VVNAPRAIDRSRERALCQHIPFRRRSPSSSTMGVCILTGKTTTGTVATCILRSFTPLSLQLSMN
jgi:hypothetical protein